MVIDQEYQKIKRIPIKYIPIMIMAAFSINILSLALPLTMKQIYNKIILNESVETLTILIIGCVVAMGLESFLKKTKATSSKWIASKYEYQLTSFLTKKILNSYEIHSNSNGYNANIEKFNSIPKLATHHSTRLYELFVDLPFMLLFLYLIFYLGGLIVIVPIILSVLYIIIMFVISKSYFNSRQNQITTNDILMSQLSETLEKVHLVKAAGLEEFQIAKFKKSLEKTTKVNYQTNKLLMISEIIPTYFSQLILFSILIAGGYLMVYEGILFGEITACALLGGRAVAPIQSLLKLYMEKKDIQLLSARIDQIALRPNQYAENVPFFPDDIEGTIEINNLLYNNVQTHRAETLTLHINSGSFVYFHPATFLSYREIFNKIVGKEKIEGGKILIDNLDISEWNMNSLKGKIEYLSDWVSLYKGSVIDNITYFNQSKNQDAYAAAALTGLDVLVAKMSEGFETVLDAQDSNYLSSAFLQRLKLTRVLLSRPRIMILDRIDEGMDYETLTIFIWLLEKFKGRLTILIATDNQVIKNMADIEIHEAGKLE